MQTLEDSEISPQLLPQMITRSSKYEAIATTDAKYSVDISRPCTDNEPSKPKMILQTTDDIME